MVTPSRQVLLEIRNLSKNFGGVQAITDVSLDFKAGIITTLVGPNGAGKTTLFNMITGHIPPSGGDIFWNGQSIVGYKPWEIARMGIARTFQDLRLFTNMTVEENVLTVMERSSWFWQPGRRAAQRVRRARAETILEATRLADKANVRALDLAFAERKFLSLARIMATDAVIWLLDEPASGLDPRSYDLLLHVLRDQVKSGMTICIIEHNLDIVISISDRIIFLDQGKLLADGNPKSILSDPHLAEIYFGGCAA